MPLSWNEIRSRAIAFSKEWQDASNESADAKSFWDDFFKVFGLPRRRIAAFEHHVKKAGDQAAGYIDLFWPGMLIAEHKSRGRDLDRAFDQAMDYFPGIRDADLPRYVVVSDFARIRVHDLETGEETEIELESFHEHIQIFGFVAGYQQRTFKEGDPVNIKAADKLARLHDTMLSSGYSGHELELYLVRILFCLFAEDTGIFLPRGAFQDLIENRTREDGSDLGAFLAELFEVLNTPPDKRLKNRDEQLLALPFVNGELFAERLRTAGFDSGMRALILECCELDWGQISPAIFGSLFQGIMDQDMRRALGAHYTAEENILKVINPLFLNELWAEFNRVKNQRAKLQALHEKLAQLQIFDPACGCGNFLVIAYREIRLLELEIIRTLYSQDHQQLSLDAIEQYVKVDVDQFHGIEIEEWPAQIARTAMWLIDHQMNVAVSQEFGNALVRIPLVKSANIIHANALEVDWREVVLPERVTHIMGNPPFGGARNQSKQQRAEMEQLFEGVKSNGLLDYVSAWYLRAVEYLCGAAHESENAGDDSPAHRVKVGFVSTNSIVQGEQVGVLWGELLKRGVKIHFAHRTFQWQSEAPGKAAVHCVIIGFALFDTTEKWIFDYPDIRGDPVAAKAANINPYLVDASDVTVGKQSSPLCDVPILKFGNMPNDKGNLLLTQDECSDLLSKEPGAKPWLRPFISAREFINNEKRWCLWLEGISPQDLRALPQVRKRVETVREYRKASTRKATQKLADYPTLFGEIRQPDTNFLLIPRHTSENRPYIPIGFFGPENIVADSCLFVPEATPYHFGILSSVMHMSWMRYVGGRLKSDYRYSGSIVYNNFPWPVSLSKAQIRRVEDAAQGVLDARSQFPDASLAALYDAVDMPPALRRAHSKLDDAVDKAYGRRKFQKEPERVAFLFERYAELVGE